MCRILENEVGESIGARTSCLITFKELGPPDLVHLSKSHPKTNLKENGTYHYVTGVDTSGTAMVAAYMNTLTFSLGENQLWFGKHPMWKVHSGIYCSYNAFSRVDVRVLVQIPGSVEAHVVDDKGDKRPATEDHWTETYMSAMLRSLLFTDDDMYYVTACRRLDPLSRDSGEKFFSGFEKLFYQGPNLGTVSEVQVATLVSNLLVDGFFKFVQVTGLYDQAIETVQRLQELEPTVVSLLSKLYLLKNQEVEAVQTMSKGILDNLEMRLC